MGLFIIGFFGTVRNQPASGKIRLIRKMTNLIYRFNIARKSKRTHPKEAVLQWQLKPTDTNHEVDIN